MGLRPTLRMGVFASAVPLITRFPVRWWATLIPTRSGPGAVLTRARREPDVLMEAIDDLIAAGKPMIRHGCLTRGLTGLYALRWAGVDVDLAFGVGRVRDEFTGHCWLVRNGEPLGERRDPSGTFTEMFRLDEAITEDLSALVQWIGGGSRE